MEDKIGKPLHEIHISGNVPRCMFFPHSSVRFVRFVRFVLRVCLACDKKCLMQSTRGMMQ